MLLGLYCIKGSSLLVQVLSVACARSGSTAKQSDELRASFDHLVGAGEQGLWHGEAKRLGSFHINDQLVFGRRLHR